MIKLAKIKIQRRQRRSRRVRARISGTATRPRLAVFRSLKHLSAQLIDDTRGETILMTQEDQLVDKNGTKTERAQKLGTLLAARAQEKGFSAVVFDRRHYRYHGRIRAFADAARAAGLKF